MTQRMFRKVGYEQRHRAQMDAWVAGKPQHNQEDDECTPDFSCCRPHLLTDEASRQIFANAANPAVRNVMLAAFFARLAADAISNKKVHVAGTDTGEN